MPQVLQSSDSESIVFSFRSAKGEIAFSNIAGGPIWHLNRVLPDGTRVALSPQVRWTSDAAIVFDTVPGQSYVLTGGNAGPSAWAEDAGPAIR